jgi:hypothetical protein
VRTYLKTKTKQNERAGDLAQVVESWLRKLWGPRFNPQNCKKKNF